MARCLEENGMLPPPMERYGFQESFTLCVSFLRFVLSNLPSLLILHAPLLIPVALFMIFIYQNEGVVMGDKEHHPLTLHPAMILHQVAAIFICTAPLTLPASIQSGNTLKVLFSWRFLLCTFSCFLIIEYGCLSHPFLLADNRHYMFYIWKRLLSRRLLRRLLIPVYSYAVIHVWDVLLEAKGLLWAMIFFVAIITTMLPAHLIVRFDINIFILDSISIKTMFSYYSIVSPWRNRDTSLQV